MNLVYRVMEFSAGRGSNLNSGGFTPKIEGLRDFNNIIYLDQICAQAGGIKVKSRREDASPLLKGTWTHSAFSQYWVGNSNVIHRSSGYPTSDHIETTVIVPEGETPDTDIVALFRNFYGAEPRTTTEIAKIKVNGISLRVGPVKSPLNVPTTVYPPQ